MTGMPGPPTTTTSPARTARSPRQTSARRPSSKASPRPPPPAQQQTFDLPGTIGRYVAMRAVDKAGNLGPVRVRDRGPGSSPGAARQGRLRPPDQRHPRPRRPDRNPPRRCDLRATGQRPRPRGRRDRLRPRRRREGSDRRRRARRHAQGRKGARRALEGGNGRDVLRGGYGRDILKARDDTTDVVDCGPGRRDTAIADASDRLKRWRECAASAPADLASAA